MFGSASVNKHVVRVCICIPCNDDELFIFLGLALSAVVDWMNNSIAAMLDDYQIPVYALKTVFEMYKEKLRSYGASDEWVEVAHRTRFKENLLKSVPGIIETTTGKSIMITLDGELGKALFQACLNSNVDDSAVITDAARRIRKVLFLDKQTFDGDLSRNIHNLSVPPHILHLVSMILEGGTVNRDLSESQQRIATNISELLRFNAVKRTRRSSAQNFHHSAENEPPLPVAVGLVVHSKTRKKALVETLHTEGLSISYDRVMKIRSSISSQICEGYREIGFVCPPTLNGNLFTSAAIDNIDHNLTSTTATSSIHWTGISIFQHPDGAVEHKALNYRVKSDINDKLKLPHSYTDI